MASEEIRERAYQAGYAVATKNTARRCTPNDLREITDAVVRAIAEDRAGEKDKGPGIPSNVYWSPEHGNFYDIETHKGMGNGFYVEYRDRIREFPTDPRLAPSPKAGTEWRDVPVTAGWLADALCDPAVDSTEFPMMSLADINLCLRISEVIQRAAESRAKVEKG